jgi:hypothetical protein
MRPSSNIPRRSKSLRRLSEFHRGTALLPLWILLRLAILFLPQRHPMKRLSFSAFRANSSEAACWIGIGLWAALAIWLWSIFMLVSRR